METPSFRWVRLQSGDGPDPPRCKTQLQQPAASRPSPRSLKEAKMSRGDDDDAREFLANKSASDAETHGSDGEDADASSGRGSAVQNDSGDAAQRREDDEAQDDIKARRRSLLEKIALFEKRGAILPSDAHTLRFQVHDSTSGQWRAVEERLKQLACSWNPYQDYSAQERREKEQAVAAGATSPNRTSTGGIKRPGRHVNQRKKKDFYELLGLSSRSASQDEIKKQFRKLALQLHPDKQQKQQPSDDADPVPVSDSTEFARLRVAYETLNDPVQRAAYDVKLAEIESGALKEDALIDGIQVKHQIKLEASTDFASLEWMARVKHKMDVMDRIAEWAKLLQIRATDLRFETGEPCIGRGCGKIVSMDRDLECYGSPRRRVYVCLLHKYIHACDETCTSHYGDTELDQKACTMRAFWLVQNWLFDTLQQQQIVQAHRIKLGQEEEEKNSYEVQNSHPGAQYELVPSEIHLGDSLTTFSLAKVHECGSHQCRDRFQFLEDGIFVCRRHGTPHICTFEQCDRKELRDGKYICWVSNKLYGHKREDAGTGTRTRRVVYTDSNGESNAIYMEVPVLLPLGKMTSFLLEGGPKSAVERSSSLSPPPPAEKMYGYGDECDDCDEDDEDSVGSPSRPARSSRPPRRAMTVASYKRAREDEISPTRARIRRRLNEKVEQADSSFHIFLHVPEAVANLPRVALELQEQVPVVRRPRASSRGGPDGDDEEMEQIPVNNVLPIRVRPRNTLNYIKHWMEELTEQLISIWDQQIYWGDTLIGDEARVMTLEEHGIHDGVALELRLHDDCPLLVGNWTGKQTIAGEYNTVQISKEAEEELDEQQEENEYVVAAEEEAFQCERLQRKRERLAQVGAIHHTEVIEYHGSVPRLVGVIPETPQELKKLAASTVKPISVAHLEVTRSMEKDAIAMRQVASTAVPVIKKKDATSTATIKTT